MQALLVLLITAGLNAQAMILTVNDNRSHGAIGDSRLSLDEAIQLINLDNIARSGYLTTAGFSAAERAQLVPNLAGDDLIKLDGTAAPLISYERELTAVVTSVHQHQDVTILGLGNPTLDAKGFSAAFPVRTNHAQIIGMRITGGITAIEADSSLHYHPSTIGRFINLEISGQSQAGIRFPIKPNLPGQALPFRMIGCRITGDPIGIDVAANTLFPLGDFEVDSCKLQSNAIGIRMSAQTTLGVILVKVIRTDVINSETCVQVRRPSAASDGRVDLQVLFGEFTASHHGIDVEGVANGETNIQCQQASLRGGPASTDYAFTTRPKSARFDISVSENALEGNVAILGSVDTTRIWAHNNRFRNGSFAIDNDGATGVPDLQQNTFESCPFSVAQSSTTPFVVVQSEFVRSPISCASTAGSVILDRCYRGSSPLSGSVSDQNPAGARWLGFASVTPATPLIGAYVDLQLDYPPDMLGAWLIGTSVSHPNTGTYPFRYYFSTTSFFGVPGPFALRDRARLAIPADSSLKGIEFFAQPVAVPTTLKSWQWPITLPPGGRFLVQ